VSWDSQGNIWAVTAGGAWVLPPGQQQFVPVRLPRLPGDNPAGYDVRSLRVAPDAVRVAMLVQVEPTAAQAGGTQVVMAAVTRTSGEFVLGPTVAVGPTLASPVALSWLDPDHLCVLTHSELFSVPVNGGVQDPIDPAPPGAGSITATGPGHIALAGGGQIWTSSGLDQVMQPVLKGSGVGYQE
jgi:hypothetical protein